MSKGILRIFISAILLRVLVMPFLFQIDLKSLYYYASFLQHGVFNLYQYMADYNSLLHYRQVFVYPPPIYFLQGIWVILVNPFLGSNFGNWINDWGVNNYTSAYLFRYLFILKIPYLLFDVATGILLLKLVDEKIKKRVLLLWFFNPVTLYINYGLANFDIVPTFLVLLSLFFYSKNNFGKSGITLGIATAFKIFPLVLWPFFLYPIIKSYGREKTIHFFGGAFIAFSVLNLPWIDNLIPVYNSGLTNRAFEFKIPFIELQVPLVYLLLFLLFVYYVLKKQFDSITLSKFIFCVLLIMLSITDFHPQWWMWLLPFFVILCAQNLIYLVLFVPIIALAGLLIIGLNDQFITIGILNPLIPAINNSSFLHDLLFRTDSNKLSVISKNILIALSLMLVVLVNLKLKLKFFKIPDKLLFTFLILTILISSAGFFSLGVLSNSRKILGDSLEESVLRTPVYKNHSYRQDISTNVTNVHLVNFNLKNVNLQNNDPFNITIDNNEGQKREFKLTGGNIGDEQWLNLRIDPININGKLTVSMDSTTESTDSAIMVLENADHKLSYRIYKRENPFSEFRIIGSEFFENLSRDPYFLVFYLGIIIFLTGMLGMTFSGKKFLK